MMAEFEPPETSFGWTVERPSAVRLLVAAPLWIDAEGRAQLGPVAQTRPLRAHPSRSGHAHTRWSELAVPPDAPATQLLAASVATPAGRVFLPPPVTPERLPTAPESVFVVHLHCGWGGFRVAGRPVPPRMLARVIRCCSEWRRRPVLVLTAGGPHAERADGPLLSALAAALDVPVFSSDAGVYLTARSVFTGGSFFRVDPPSRRVARTGAPGTVVQLGRTIPAAAPVKPVPVQRNGSAVLEEWGRLEESGRLSLDQTDGVDEAAVPGQATSSDWHLLLMRMAGAVPDDLICTTRTWLAQGRLDEVARALAFAAAEGLDDADSADDHDGPDSPFGSASPDSSVGLNSSAGLNGSTGADSVIASEDRSGTSLWRFAPEPAEAGPGAGPAPMLLDLTIDPADRACLDAVDRAALTEAESRPGITALWRAWRVPVSGARWPAPRRVFIVEVAASAPDIPQLPVLTARIQAALATAGEPNPQVEVYRAGTRLPAYQSLACAHAALLWALEPATPIRLARVFDAVLPQQGPVLHDHHPVIEDLAEIARLLAYLRGVPALISTSGRMEDVVDPAHPRVVPLTFRTDGQWIWTDSVSYYLDKYSVVSDDDLLAHLRAGGSLPSAVSAVGVHRALVRLQQPRDQP